MDQREEALIQIKKIVTENNLTLSDVTKSLQRTAINKIEVVSFDASEILAYMGGVGFLMLLILIFGIPAG